MNNYKQYGSLISLVASLAFVSALSLPLANVHAAATVTIASASVSTSTNKILIRLDDPGGNITAVDETKWHLDVNTGGTSASTSVSAIILKAAYPWEILLEFEAGMAASYDASHGIYVEASGVTAGGNTNAVLAHDASIAVAAADAGAPTLSAVTIASSNSSTTLAKVGNVPTLSFTSSESIMTPVVTLAGHTATVVGSGTSWTASTTMLTGDTEGNVAINIAFADFAYNDGTDVTAIMSGSNVRFDKTAPTISLIGNASVSSPVNATYVDAGAGASDSAEGDMSSSIVTTNPVVKTAATYTVAYNVSDSAGNAATEVTRTVKVTPVGGSSVANISFSGGGNTANNTVQITPASTQASPQATVAQTAQATQTPAVVSTENHGALVSAAARASAGIAGPVSFARALGYRAKHADVMTLQKLLATDPDIYPNGLATGYFGPATLKAVKLFQEKYGIAAPGVAGYGNVGPKTRAKLNELYGN